MLEPFALEGTFVRLEPLSEAHIPGLVQAAGTGQKRAPGVIDQSQLGTGEENAAKDHGPQQTGLAGRSQRAQKPVKFQRVPMMA